jgi:hypothetical protein
LWKPPPGSWGWPAALRKIPAFFSFVYYFRMPRAQRTPATDARRLVKLWLPASLLAAMDEVIRSTRAYNGREDFVAEAISDRIADERARPNTISPPSLEIGERPNEVDRGLVLALWESASVVTAPGFRIKEPMLGLHNRDYPTLWAADLLANIVAARGEALSWIHFVARAASAAWTASEALAALDDDRTEGTLKATVAFPKNPLKRNASEARFTEHMLGSLRQGRASGPLFALGLAGIAEGAAPDRIAPTKAGLALLRALRAAGLGPRPPHPPRAWFTFRDHLKSALPADLRQWTIVLEALAEGPSPEEAAVRFQGTWQGSTAQTNINGYVSRGREWGLVEPKLAEGRYKLTPLGIRTVEEATK